MENLHTERGGTTGRWLRAGALACLVLWMLLWVVFLLLKSGVLDLRMIPAVGTVMLAAIASVLLLPVLAIGLGVAALLWPPRTMQGWLILAVATVITLGQVALFVMSAFL